jgi:hypothetical protein
MPLPGKLIPRCVNTATPIAKKPGARPLCKSSRAASEVGLPERASLPLPCGQRIPRDRAGGIDGSENGRTQAHSSKGSKYQVFHRNSPSIVGRDVRLR